MEHDLDRKPVPTFRDHAPNLFLVDDADEMLNLGDHAANRRRVLQFGHTTDLVELEADQRRALRVMAADCAAGLLDLDRLCGLGHRLNSKSSWLGMIFSENRFPPFRIMPRVIPPPLRRHRRRGATAAWRP